MSEFLSTASNKKQYFLAGIASVASMALSIPVAIALSASPSVGATPSTVKTADANYAQYAHAFTQGYLASATTEGAIAGSCTEGGLGAGAVVSEDGAVAGAVTTVAWEDDQMAGGRGAVDWDKKYKPSGSVMSKSDWAKQVTNSYNHYYSQVNNNAHTEVHNKNSNNVIGSNNRNETSVKVEDSEDVFIAASTKNETTNMAVIDSLNHDSYNTANDSFNTTNTTTTNTAVVEDSYNEKNETTTNTTNTAIVNESYNEKTIENVGNETTDNSDQDNSVDIIDNEVEIEVELEGGHAPRPL